MSRDIAIIQVEKMGIQSTTCDNCHKRVLGEPEDWVHLDASHNDWDGAPETSSEHLDACSAPCLLQVLKQIADDYGEQDNPTLRVWMGGVHYRFIRGLASYLTERKV